MQIQKKKRKRVFAFSLCACECVRVNWRFCLFTLYIVCPPPPLPSPPSPPPPLPSPLPAVYGFFATPSDGKLLSNASIGEGSQNGLMVYFGLLKGLPPSIRKVQFKTDTPNQGQEQGEYCPLNVDFAFLFLHLLFLWLLYNSP